MFSEDEYDAAGCIELLLKWAIAPRCVTCKDRGRIGQGAGGGRMGYREIPCPDCEVREMLAKLDKARAEGLIEPWGFDLEPKSGAKKTQSRKKK